MSAGIVRQAELPFSEEDRVQMLRDDNRHMKDRILALEEANQYLHRMLFGSSSEKIEKGDWIISVEEGPLPDEPEEGPKAATEPGKKAERETARTGNDPEWSRRMEELITPLYRIEKELRESKAPPEAIAEKRQEASRPIAEGFFEALQERMKQNENPPVNILRRAILYALERRDTLMTRLKVPHIPIDNNAVERAIRTLAVGRRNSLFIGSPEAGKRAAFFYTTVRECQRVKVDSEAWLTAVLRRLPDYRGDYLDLLPGMLELPEAGDSSASVKA